MKTLPLIPYIRQSRKKEVTISLDSQREAIKRWAEANGVSLAAEVCEQGVSGSKPWRERELGEAIAACERGEAGGIIVAYQDRLSRENGLGTAEVWEALDKARARFVAAAEGLDTATGGSDARMLFSIKAAVARHQWERYQANFAVAVARGIADGKYIGRTPVGYDRLDGGLREDGSTRSGAKRDGRLRKNEDAPAVERAFRVRAGGDSWSEVARSLQAAGVKTATGDPRWGIASARSLVMNPIYKGTLKNGREHHFPEYAIVPPSLWEKVQPVPTGRPGRRDAGSWALLGGLVFCEGCGHRITPNRTTTQHGNSYRYYMCKSIKCPARATCAADEIEAYVLEQAAHYFEAVVAAGGVGHGRETDSERVAGLEIALEDAKARRRAAALALDPQDAKDLAALEQLASEVEACKAALTEELGASRVTVTPEQFRAALAEAGLDERRQLVRGVLDHVTVTRGKGLLADRVEVEYRTLVF